MLRLAVVIPTYNEVTNVQNLIDAIAKVSLVNPDTELTVVVIDDSSPDGTAALVESLADGWKTDRMSVRVINKP
ncbi:glycosyltransferase, partial [Conyzicola sp.]|uniref:glycosyltransferase n=1 Tax=Conyzicola sp. TaxID=1969404 RepID=UPI00398A0E73